MTAGQIALWVGLLIAFGYTVYGYPHKYGALSGRSRLFRTVGLLVIDLLLVLVLMGTYIDFAADVSRRVGAIRWAFYWGACIILGLTLPLIAALDALESFVAVRREKRQYLEEMIQEELARVQAQQAAKKQPAASGAAADSSETRDNAAAKPTDNAG